MVQFYVNPISALLNEPQIAREQIHSHEPDSYIYPKQSTVLTQRTSHFHDVHISNKQR